MEEKEFELMREQISALKDKLEHQEIVTDALMRKILKGKKSVIDRNRNVTFACGLFCIVLFPLLHYSIGISWPFVIVTILYMLFCIVGTFLIHRPMDRADLMSEDLLTVAQLMGQMRHRYGQWLKYVTPTAIPWVLWYWWDTSKAMNVEPGNSMGLFIGMLIGLCIGGIWGYCMHKKVVDACKEVIDQINGN